MLDLVLLSGQKEGDLEVEEMNSTPLSWTDHFLMRFRLVATLLSGPPWILMDPNGFLRALGEFPADKVSDSSQPRSISGIRSWSGL